MIIARDRLVNSHLYHYAGNNPVNYVDPDGRVGIPVLIDVPKDFHLEIPMTRNDLKGFYIDIENEYAKNKNMFLGINIGFVKEKLTNCNTFVGAITSFDTISKFMEANAPLLNKTVGIAGKFAGIKDLYELVFPNTVSETRDNFHTFYTQIEGAEVKGEKITNIKLIVDRTTKRKTGIAIGGVPSVVFATTTTTILYAEKSDGKAIKEKLKVEETCLNYFWCE